MALHRRVALAALALLVTVSVAAPVSAAPPPETVCGLCDDEALDGGVERSEVEVRVRDDGAADWTVRLTLSAATATELRAAPERRDELVREGLTHRSVVDEVRTLETSVDGRTLIATFTVPDFAHRGVGGVLVVDGLFPSNEYASVSVHADRLTVRGPDGTVPTVLPDSAHAEDGAIVWGGDSNAARSAELGSETYLAFGADDGLLATGGSYVAVGTEVVVDDAGDVLPVAAGHVLAFGVVLAGLAVAGDRLRPTGPSFDTRIGLLVAGATPVLLAGGVGLVLLGSAAEGLLEGPSLLVGLAMAGLVPQALVTAAAAATVAFARDRYSVHAVPSWALVVGSLAWVVTVGSTGPNRLLGTWATTSLLFLLLGVAHERGSRASVPIAAVALCAPVLAVVPFTSPGWHSPVVLVVWSAGTLTCGLVLYAVGRGAADKPGGRRGVEQDGRVAGTT